MTEKDKRTGSISSSPSSSISNDFFPLVFAPTLGFAVAFGFDFSFAGVFLTVEDRGGRRLTGTFATDFDFDFGFEGGTFFPFDFFGFDL